MQVIRDVCEIRKKLSAFTSKSVGFVPTMGALHLGHTSLIQQAKKHNDIVVVSIFVNPTQFGEDEDFSTYPRKEEADIQISAKAGCDILFLPQLSQIYTFSDAIKIKPPFINGYILEGCARKSHFDGVMQILVKFFNIINPTKAYFGKKDAQQLILIKQLVEDLCFDIDIVACDTIREKDGLALSSRNVYLNSKTRMQALSISKALGFAYTKIQKGHTDSKYLISQMQEILADVDVDYIAITDRNLKQINSIKIKNSIIMVAILINKKRFLDNLWI